MTRTDEELLRDAMHKAGAEPASFAQCDEAVPAAVAQVLRRGRAARARRRRLVTVGVAAVLVGGIAAGSALLGRVGGGSATSASSPSLPAPVLAPARVVAAGERFDVGYGYTFRMGENQAVIVRGGCGVVVDLGKP